MSLPDLERCTPSFSFELTFHALDFQTEWKRCDMLANYIAAYAAYQFPLQERAENIISTITNELLETVVRLAPEPSELSIQFFQLEEGLRLEARHLVRTEAMDPYLSFLNNLTDHSDEQAYLELLTTEIKPSEYFNELGLMMLAHDFGVKLAVNHDDKTDRFYTTVFVATEEFSA
jgi:hypothetical protein